MLNLPGIALLASAAGADDLPLITTIAVGFSAAWLLGLVTQSLRLSPIVGYLLAGVVIGPHTPGFVGDIGLAHQLAEIGVILLMFGVGLHFHLEDLMAVKWVAIPGALGQSLGATLAGMFIFSLFGVELSTGAVIGMAMAVASTVVLMRVLLDADALNSAAGHVAVGWLLVEDVLTVIILVLIPVLGVDPSADAAAAAANPVMAITIALVKLAALVGIVILVGGRVIPWALMRVARLRSRELFTLTVMVFSVAIAAGAYWLFGASMALGAFLAGMMVAQSPVSHQAAADALPLRDAFAVLFFVSVGMLFDPRFLIDEPLMMLAAMGVILLVKPLIALAIVAILGHSVRTALTVALGLAQIGEFSFILSDSARRHGLMTDEGHSLLVAGAILSITLNPMLFRSIDSIERWLRRRPKLWAMLNSRAERRVSRANGSAAPAQTDHSLSAKPLAVVVGFGPVGRSVDRLLRDAGMETLVIDMNMDTVSELKSQGRAAIFGDASQASILEMAQLAEASHLVLTLPQTSHCSTIVSLARGMNPKLKIFVRARYLRDRDQLELVGATAAIFEEGEAAVALARLVLADSGAGRELIERTVRDIRMRIILENVSTLRTQRVYSIMIPWTRVRRLETSASLDEVRRQVGQQRFSRWPVVQSATGELVGYLLAKDLIGLNPGTVQWTDLIRPLGSVAADNDIESTLHHFQEEGVTMCVVREGEVPVGIVTLEDILEQVVGHIGDEYARPERWLLQDVVLTDNSLLDLKSTTSEDAIREMASHIPRDLLPPGADVAELALARERELPTSIGFGVAVPHARCPLLSKSFVVLGRSRDGILFSQESPQRIHLIFMLITPAEQPDAQVLLLGQLAGAIGDPARRDRLRSAANVAEVGEILAEADRQRFDAAGAAPGINSAAAAVQAASEKLSPLED